MRRVHLLKRDLFRDLLLGIAMSVVVFACALALGGPFLSRASYGATLETPRATFVGTVRCDGGQLVLRDDAGRVYHLDDTQQAEPYEGKAVTVTGTLDPSAQVLHVERIEPTRG